MGRKDVLPVRGTADSDSRRDNDRFRLAPGNSPEDVETRRLTGLGCLALSIHECGVLLGHCPWHPRPDTF